MRFEFGPDIYACIANRRVAILDLAAGNYFCAPEDLNGVLGKIVEGMPLTEAEANSVNDLVQDGILQITTAASELNLRPSPPRPSRSYPASSPPDVPMPAIAAALVCHVLAALRLRFFSLRSVIGALRRRTQNRSRSHSPAQGQLRQRIAAIRLAERILPSGNKCLRRSLALKDSLASALPDAQLIIGVKTKPFGAHAWVQHDDVVLNDTVDSVCAYTPILAV